MQNAKWSKPAAQAHVGGLGGGGGVGAGRGGGCGLHVRVQPETVALSASCCPWSLALSQHVDRLDGETNDCEPWYVKAAHRASALQSAQQALELLTCSTIFELLLLIITP